MSAFRLHVAETPAPRLAIAKSGVTGREVAAASRRGWCPSLASGRASEPCGVSVKTPGLTDRLTLLRDELARFADTSDDERQAELVQLARDRAELDRSLYRQALRLEEHDDPAHPIIALAKQRIDELSARRDAIDERVRQVKATRPTVPTAQEIEALLDAVPDLRPVMQEAPPAELSELFAAFGLTATYDKSHSALRLAATLSPDLVPPLERPRPPKKAVGEIFHSGGRI
jgi:hypothetical protein